MQTTSLRIILLPGIYGTGLLFEPLINALPEDYDCRVISYPTHEVLSYSELVHYVAEKIPQDKPFVILAESFAGPLGLMLSEILGENLAALILVCSFVKNPRPWLSKLAWLVLHDRLLAIPPSRFMAKFMIAGFEVDDEMLALAFAIQKKVLPRVFRSRLQEVMAMDVSECLRSLSIPLLHLYATGDRIIPRSAQRVIARLKPDAISVAIDGPHYLLQTKAEQSVRHITKFLESL